MSSSSSACDCEIIWASDIAITDFTRNVLPGHQINLKIKCVGATPTDIQWSLPGKVFKSWSQSRDLATLNEMAPGDLDDQTVHFCWADVGDARSVSVTFKVNNQPCSATQTFNVKDPTVTYPTGYNPRQSEI